VLSIGEEYCRVGYSDKLFLELVKFEGTICHSSSIGRLAISVPVLQMDAIEESVQKNGNKVHTKRIKLETPGKATVEVVILLDPDNYEICIVGAEAFYQLCEATYDIINWEKRIESGSLE